MSGPEMLENLALVDLGSAPIVFILLQPARPPGHCWRSQRWSGGVRDWSQGETRDTICQWTDGSRQGSGKVGAACVWKTQEGWTGRRFYLGSNKEVFDAETFAVYQALCAFDQRQERGHRYTHNFRRLHSRHQAHLRRRTGPRSALRHCSYRGLLTGPRQGQQGYRQVGPSAQRGRR